MKSTIFLILIGFTILSACKDHEKKNENTTWLPDVSNKDHGPVKQKQFIGDFDEIEVSQSIKAEIIKSNEEKVVIAAPENIIDEILVDNTGGELHIHYKPGFRIMNTVEVKAKIYTRDFTKLEANSAAEIIVKDKFIQEKTEIETSSAGSISGKIEANDLSIDASSSANFKGEIWARNLDLDASSAGSISISGKTKNAQLNASSGSEISAKDLVAESAQAEASSGSSVQIGVSSKFQANASSGGSVNGYKKGNVTMISKEESSGGSVNLQ